MKEGVELKDDNEELHKVVSDLQERVEDMHVKMMNLIKVGDALEKEYLEFKSQGPPMTEATKK